MGWTGSFVFTLSIKASDMDTHRLGHTHGHIRIIISFFEII